MWIPIFSGGVITRPKEKFEDRENKMESSQKQLFFFAENATESTKSLLELVEQMPASHKSTLRYLMAHFIRLWQIQHDSGMDDGLDKLSHVFCHILLRPPWEKIM